MRFDPTNSHIQGSASRNLSSQRRTTSTGRDSFSEILDSSTTSGRVQDLRERVTEERKQKQGFGSSGRKATDTSHTKNILQAKQALQGQAKPKSKTKTWDGIASSAGPKAKKVVAELVDTVDSGDSSDEFVSRSEFDQVKEQLANLSKTIDKLLEKGSGPSLNFGEDHGIEPDINVAYQNNTIYNAMTPNAFNRPGNFDTHA